jgi:two-component system chemotaxis sensor kinase CheA
MQGRLTGCPSIWNGLKAPTNGLDQLDVELVRLEQDPNNAAMLNTIFRLVHTVRRTCGFLGLTWLAKLAHVGKLQALALDDASPSSGESVLDDRRPGLKTLDDLEHAWRETPGPDMEPDEPADALGDSVDANGREAHARAQTVKSRRASDDHRQRARSHVRRTGDSEFKSPLQRLSNVTAELQEGIMKARMQLIANTWQRLPRLVRELSLDLDKKIELEMTGGDTELDWQVPEMIKDLLTHMIRNSADHGIEFPVGEGG